MALFCLYFSVVGWIGCHMENNIYIYIYGWHGLIYWGFIFYNQPKNLWDYSLIVVAVGGDRKFEINNWHGLFQQKQHWHGFKYEVLLIANYNPHLEWGFGN